MNVDSQDFFPSFDKTVIISNSARAKEISAAIGAKILPLNSELSPEDTFGNFNLVIFICAVPIAVRMLAKVDLDKTVDPAVLCIDETLSHCIVLLGAHRGGNQAARYIETTLHIPAIITTASDLLGSPALDQIPRYHARGNLASLQQRINRTQPIAVIAESERIPYPLKAFQPQDDGQTNYVVEVTRDGASPEYSGVRNYVQLIKQRLVVGIGCSTDCSSSELFEAVKTSLDLIGADMEQVLYVATIDIRKDHPAITSLGLGIKTYSASELQSVQVPNPSAVVEAEVGTASVAEAACSLGVSPTGKLVLEKQKFPKSTVAVAQVSDRGIVSVVGIGPGSPLLRTRKSEIVLRTSEIIIGFEGYLHLCRDLLTPGQTQLSYKIGEEIARVDRAIQEAAKGASVALVCSGDPGIYAMASLLFERRRLYRNLDNFDVEVVPGVTAALAASSLGGAILGHDHAYVSLSDLLTPWEYIKDALIKLAPSHLALIFYNPRSKSRQHQFREAMEILSKERGADTPVLVARAVSRPNQMTKITTIGELDESIVDMETIVIVGGPWTTVDNDIIFTRRGYKASDR